MPPLDIYTLAAFTCAFGATDAFLSVNFKHNIQRKLNLVTPALVNSYQLDPPDNRFIKVFDGDYSSAICEEVVKAAADAIKLKGSFSLCIPGGSVVTALKGLPEGPEYSKWHIFFANERIGEEKCYEGALNAFARAKGIPQSHVHKVGRGAPDEVAYYYEKLLRFHPSIDNKGSMPSVDLILLGTGDDGHCGSLYPNSEQIKAYGNGKAVLGISEGDKKSIAVSMDFMCAAKLAVVSAASKVRAKMVARALQDLMDENQLQTLTHGAGKANNKYDCPAGMVFAKETVWLTDTESIAEFNRYFKRPVTAA